MTRKHQQSMTMAARRRQAPAKPGLPRSPSGAMLSIGALARATGIAVDTLRTWERRYGFPVPERKPSGHRVYALASVVRLKRIGEAIARGNRAGEVVGASDEELGEILGAAQGSDGSPAQAAAYSSSGHSTADLMRLVAALDGEGIKRALLSEWGRLGPVEFLRQGLAPLAEAVGEAWASGKLDIVHEHFLTERTKDLLRSLRMPLEERARGPLLVLATLPGESHTLGLQMTALLASSAGWRDLLLGSEVPIPQITSVARDTGARAVGVSVSRATRGRVSEGRLRELRAGLPRRTLLLVGGAGAPAPFLGIEVVTDLSALDSRLRAIASP